MCVTIVIIVIVVFFVEVALMDLTANLTPRRGCRVDIGIGALGLECIGERVEITCSNKLR